MPLFSRGGGSGTGTPDRPDKSDKSASNDDPPTPSSSSKSFSARLLRRRPSAKVVPPLVDPGDTETSASASASEPPTASSDGFSLGPPVPPLHLHGHDHDVVDGDGGRGGWMARGQFGSVSPRIKRPPRPPYTTSASATGSAGGTGTVVIDAGGPAPTWTTPLSFGTGPLASTSAGPGGSGSWHDAWEQDASWARARRSADEVRAASPDSPPLYPTPLSPPRRNTAPRVRPPIPQPTALPGPSTTADGADPSTGPDADAGDGADVVGSRAWLARKPSTGKLRRARPDPSSSSSGIPSPVLRRTQPQRSPVILRGPSTPEQYPSRGGGGLQPSPVLLTASSSSQGQRGGGGGDDWSVGGSASVESSDLDGEGEIGLGASAVADPDLGRGRRTPSPTLMPSRMPQRAGGAGGGYEVQVSCVAAPAQPALELEPSATATAQDADVMGTGEITWTITIRPRPGAGAGSREAAAPSSPLHISASLPGATPDQPAGEGGAGGGSTLATAPLSASSVNLSLSLSQPVGKMVFISFPLDMTPRRTARRPSRSSRRAGTAGFPPPSVDLSDRADGSGSGWPEAPGTTTTTREKRSGWILGSPSPSPSGEVEDDLPLTPPRIRTPGAPTPSTPPRMTTPPPNPITPRRVLKYGPQNGQGPSGSPARTPRRSRESPLVFPTSAHGAASRDASLSRAVGRRSLDGRPGFGAAYGSSGGSGASSGSAGTEDVGGSSLGGGSARRSRIISASDLDGGLYAPGTVDGLSEELERAL